MESGEQDQVNHSHKMLYYGHALSCSSRAGAGACLTPWGCSAGSQAFKEIFTFFFSPPTPPPEFFHAAVARPASSIKFLWLGGATSSSPRAVAQDISHIPTPQYPVYFSLHFLQVPPNS